MYASLKRTSALPLARGAVWLAAALALGGSSCREDLGQPDYSSHAGLPRDGGPDVESLLGTDPFILGQRRANLGIFYEGGASETFPLNSEEMCADNDELPVEFRSLLRCYFIFEIEREPEAPNVLQYTQDTSTDRVEGTVSDRFRLTGTPFWGGGIIWDNATDLQFWNTLHVALKSSAPSFDDVQISMLSGPTGDAPTGTAVPASDYGYTNDGEWHVLDIPLRDFTARGVDLTEVRAPFIIGGTGNIAGDALLVDELYLE